jgi:hypothetical protein
MAQPALKAVLSRLSTTHVRKVTPAFVSSALRACAVPAPIATELANLSVAPLRSFSTSRAGFAASAARAAPAASTPAAATSAPAAEGAAKPAEGEKKVGRLSALIKAYGPIAIGTYLGIYVVVLFCIFLVVNSSFGMTAEEIIAKIESWGILSESLKKRLDGMVAGASPMMVNFAAAWIMTKFTEPIRLIVTGLITPSVARFLGRAPPAAVAAFIPLVFIPVASQRLARAAEDMAAIEDAERKAF